MKNAPTEDQVKSARSWKHLFEMMGNHPRNDRANKKIQAYVRERWPDNHLERRGSMGKLSDAEFTELVATCQSIRDVIVKGGWTVAGGSYTMVNDRISRLGLDINHMLGQAINKGRTFPPKRPIEDYLSNKIRISSNNLKQRLWKEGLKEKRCETCGITEWMDQPAPLQLDHKDGNKHDNSLENVRILCANCHAQTPTFCRRSTNV